MEWKFAYLLGLFAGDGWFEKRGITISVGSDDREFANHIAQLMSEFFRKRIVVKERIYKDGHKMILLSLHSKKVCEEIKKLLNTLRKKSKTFVVPEFKSMKDKRAFIAGIFDAEGYYHSSSRRVYFEIANKTARDKIAQMLREDNIKVCTYDRKDRDSFRLEINGCNATKLFELYPFIKLSLEARKS